MKVLSCPKCHASFENITPGQTTVTCGFCRFTTNIKDMTEGGASALLRRGMLLVEFGNFSEAKGVFDEGLNMAPEDAYLYVGQLLAELQIKEERLLNKHHTELNQYANYQKALRFADSELKRRLLSYDDQIKARLEKERIAREKREKEARERAEIEHQRKLEEEIRNAAIEAEKQKQLVAEYMEMRRRTRPKRIIRNIVILLLISGAIWFFISRRNDRINEFRAFTDVLYVASLLEEDTKQFAIESRNFGGIEPMGSTNRYRTPLTPRFMSGVDSYGARIMFYFEDGILEGVRLQAFDVVDGWEFSRITAEELERRYGVEVDHSRRENAGTGHTDYFSFYLNDNVAVEVRRSSNESSSLNSVTIQRREPQQTISSNVVSFEFDDLRLTLGGELSFTQVANQFNEYYGEYGFSIPINIENLSTSENRLAGRRLHRFSTEGYFLNHTIVTYLLMRHDADENPMSTIPPYGTNDAFINMPYTGDGVYYLRFGNRSGNGTIQTEVTVAIHMVKDAEVIDIQLTDHR